MRKYFLKKKKIQGSQRISRKGQPSEQWVKHLTDIFQEIYWSQQVQGKRAGETAQRVKALAAQTWWPEFDSWHPREGGRREQTPRACSLTSKGCCGPCAHTCVLYTAWTAREIQVKTTAGCNSTPIGIACTHIDACPGQETRKVWCVRTISTVKSRKRGRSFTLQYGQSRKA